MFIDRSRSHVMITLILFFRFFSYTPHLRTVTMSSSLIELFEIVLDHDIDEQYQYEPGQVITGHVFLKVKDAMKVKAIQVQVKGEATVSWEDDYSRGSPPYRADETYIDVNQSLLQAKSQESITLEKGKHQFPLEYALPDSLPSSFIGKYGSITYVVKATLREDQKFGLNSMITSEPFLVMRRLDLTHDKELLQPYEATASKRLWGGLAFCISGNVTADVILQKTGYVPGEDVFVDAEVNNDSPRTVKAINASIIMHSTFSAKNKSKCNMYTVNKKRDELEMTVGDGHRWRNVRITVPPYIPETRLDGCDIIDIRYEIFFKVEISGGRELKIVIPIVVGTVTNGDAGALLTPGFHPGVPNSDQYSKAPSKDRTPDPHKNGGYITNGGDHNANELDQDDLDLEEEEGFRRPMEPGETRRNPIFDQPMGSH